MLTKSINMEMSISNAIFDYLLDRSEKVSQPVVQRDKAWLNFFSIALNVRERKRFEGDLESEGENDFNLLPAARLVETLPLALDFAAERLSDEPKEFKVYLTTLKGFCRWLAAERVITENDKRDALRQITRFEEPLKAATKVKLPKHKWTFLSKFRKGGYAWNGTAKAQTNLKSALSEIRAVAKKEPGVAAEGATLLLEKLVPSIERVDGSSGAIGTVVRRTVEELAMLIGQGRDAPEHEARISRSFEALQNDEYGYLDILGEVFDKVCGSPELCSKWGSQLYSITKRTLENRGGYFAGTSACLACLYGAGHYEKLEELLSLRSFAFWSYDRWKARSLVARGKIEEALEFASSYPESSNFCEQLLLDQGRVEEAYQRFGCRLREGTYLNCFRDVCKRYPGFDKARILADLMEQTPGEAGKWFAAARWMGDLELALQLAHEGPCNPSTLMTAVKALKDKHPRSAFELACAALRSMDLGWAYELDYATIAQARQQAESLAEQSGAEAHWATFRQSFRGALKGHPEFRV